MSVDYTYVALIVAQQNLLVLLYCYFSWQTEVQIILNCIDILVLPTVLDSTYCSNALVTVLSLKSHCSALCNTRY
jgi:hypothetical protein